MSDLYFGKKNQLQGGVKPVVVDVEESLNKIRSGSPKPVQRVLTAHTTDKKILYKEDLNQFKKVSDESHEDLKKIVNDFIIQNNDSKNDINKILDELKTSVKNVNVENLKNNLNLSVSQQNKNIEGIAQRIISIEDELNKTNSRLIEIENLL
jgi:tetrahydromethanopterin S-methyltransferase subunit G